MPQILRSGRFGVDRPAVRAPLARLTDTSRASFRRAMADVIAAGVVQPEKKAGQSFGPGGKVGGHCGAGQAVAEGRALGGEPAAVGEREKR
jgi:hypothetical protein